MSRIIIVSDIHGCAYTFRTLINEQVKLTKDDQLYLLGDYIDRGPDSKGVIDFIFELQGNGFQVTCLRGNHEDMMLRAYAGDGNYARMWRRNGGDTTMQSFGLEYDMSQIPQKYIDFLNKLEYYVDRRECVMVHAGLNFEIDDPFRDQYSMLWLRQWYKNLDTDWLGNRILVHGHTPKPKRHIEESIFHLRKLPILNIDAGCYVYGHLCALDLTNGKFYFQEDLDMNPE